MLFEGARGREIVLMVLGDLTLISEPACSIWDRIMVGAVCFSFALVAKGTGSLECCIEW